MQKQSSGRRKAFTSARNGVENLFEIDCGLISTFDVEFIDFTKLCCPTNGTLFQNLKITESSGIKLLFYIAKDCHMHKLLKQIIDIPVNINVIVFYHYFKASLL